MMGERHDAPDEKRLRLRYAGVCRLCGAALPAGELAVYERAGLIPALSDEPPSTRAWERGAIGDEMMAASHRGESRGVGFFPRDFTSRTRLASRRGVLCGNGSLSVNGVRVRVAVDSRHDFEKALQQMLRQSDCRSACVGVGSVSFTADERREARKLLERLKHGGRQ
jgi:hypothetical protein